MQVSQRNSDSYIGDKVQDELGTNTYPVIFLKVPKMSNHIKSTHSHNFWTLWFNLIFEEWSILDLLYYIYQNS